MSQSPFLAFFWSKKGRVWAIFCHFWELPRRKGTLTHVFPCMWKSYGPSKRFHLVWLSQEQGCHAWLFLVKKGPVLSFFLPFLGVAKELKDPNTCFPIHLDVIWPINAFPLALVESGASLPCLASFGPKWTIFVPSPVMNGRPQSEKTPHHHVSYVRPACGTPNVPFWNINMVAINEKCQK